MNRQTGMNGIWQGLILLTASLLGGFTQAAGLLTPSDGSLRALEIRDHHVDVVIEDGYAITTGEQVFVNPHDRGLEAKLVSGGYRRTAAARDIVRGAVAVATAIGAVDRYRRCRCMTVVGGSHAPLVLRTVRYFEQPVNRGPPAVLA